MALDQKLSTTHAAAEPLDCIDAMQGLAVLMVVMVHTAQRVPGLHAWSSGLAGRFDMGVQLLFVASAYTLCLSHDRRGDEPQALRSFYVRRFFHIAPLHYLAISFYALYSRAPRIFDPDAITGPYTVRGGLANFGFVHGLTPGAHNSVVPSGWSIGTEMLFHLIFPARFPRVAILCARGRWRAFAALAPPPRCRQLHVRMGQLGNGPGVWTTTAAGTSASSISCRSS